MVKFKEKIADQIAKTISMDAKELESYIEIPKDSKNGDYAFPCFRLAKELKKAPQQIAIEIKGKMEIDTNMIEKVEVTRGVSKLLYKERSVDKGSNNTNR